MTRPYRSFLARLGAICISLASTASFAGQIAVLPVQDAETYKILGDVAKTHIDAMRKVLLRNHGEAFADPVQGNQLVKKTRAILQKATVGRFDYEFERPDGSIATRSYETASGKPASIVARESNDAVVARGQRVQGISGESSGNESASAGSRGEVSDGDWASRVRIDADDARFFPADTATRIRARYLTRGGDSVLRASSTPGTAGGEAIVRDADAEYKAMRSIENDILEGRAAPGGRLTGYVSKAVCESCQTVIDDFGEAYDVSGTVEYLVEPEFQGLGSDGARQGAQALLSERKSYSATTLNHSQVKAKWLEQNAVDDAPGAGMTNFLEERIRVEESTLSSELAEGC